MDTGPVYFTYLHMANNGQVDGVEAPIQGLVQSTQSEHKHGRGQLQTIEAPTGKKHNFFCKGTLFLYNSFGLLIFAFFS